MLEEEQKTKQTKNKTKQQQQTNKQQSGLYEPFKVGNASRQFQREFSFQRFGDNTIQHKLSL